MDQLHGLDVPSTLSDVCRPQRLALVVYDMQEGILGQIDDRAGVIDRVRWVKRNFPQVDVIGGNIATGAAALYNCANPLYHQWFTDWPPLASALLTAAERSGAVLAAMLGQRYTSEPATSGGPGRRAVERAGEVHRSARGF